MFISDSNEIKGKITKKFEKAEKELNILGIQIDGNQTDLIGMDVNKPGSLCTFFAFKSNDKCFVTGHVSSHGFAYSNFEDFPANSGTKKYIAIDGQNRENIKCYFLDGDGFGLKVTNSNPLTKDETLVIFVETDKEVNLLLAGINFYDDSKQYITFITSSNGYAMHFLRNTAFEILGLISREPIKEIQRSFNTNTQEY